MKRDIKVVRGASYELKFPFVDADGKPTTLAVGETLNFGVKKRAYSQNYAILKNITTPTDGVCVVDITPADTKDLECGTYFYDVGVENGDEYYPIIEKSKFVIAENITRRGDRP